MKMRTDDAPVGRAAEKSLAELQLAELTYHLRTHTAAVAQLTSQVVNDVLAVELVRFDANGWYSREFQTPIGCVGVANHGTGPVTVTAGSAVGATPPDRGTAMGRVAAGDGATIALTGRTLTLWGAPGEYATLQVFTRCWPPAYGSAGVAASPTGRATGIFRYATGLDAHGTHPIPAGRRSYSVLVYTAGSAASPTLDGKPLLAGTSVRFEDVAGLEAAVLVTAAGDDVLYTEVS